MLDGIVMVALENRPRYRPLTRHARELSAARICYDHLAGRLSVDLTDFFTARHYLLVGDEQANSRPQGSIFLAVSGSTLSRYVSDVVTIADCASIGPSGDRTLRVQ